MLSLLKLLNLEIHVYQKRPIRKRIDAEGHRSELIGNRCATRGYPRTERSEAEQHEFVEVLINSAKHQ